jgi:hypothetical protein
VPAKPYIFHPAALAERKIKRNKTAERTRINLHFTHSFANAGCDTKSNKHTLCVALSQINAVTRGVTAARQRVSFIICRVQLRHMSCKATAAATIAEAMQRGLILACHIADAV